jgi:hypothetical protein
LHDSTHGQKQTIDINIPTDHAISPHGIYSDLAKCRASATRRWLTNDTFTLTLDAMLTNHFPSFAEQGGMYIHLDALRGARSR